MDEPSTRGVRPVRLLLWVGGLLLLFATYHLWLTWLMRETGLVLGAVRPGNKVTRLVPLYMHWRTSLKGGLLVAIAAAALFLWWFRARAWRMGTERAGVGSQAGTVFAFTAWHILLACAVAMVDGGFSRLARPYQDFVATDYIGAVPLISSPGQFLQDFVALNERLPMHCQTHPPGGPLFLWFVARLFGPGAMPAALATIVVASLSVPAVYGLAREALPERPARLATAIFVLAPNVLLFTATSMDAVFTVPMVWTFFLLWRARRTSPVLCGALGGLSASLAALMTFSASFLALWAVVVGLLTLLFDRARLKRTLLGFATALAVSTGFYAALFAVSGYHLFEVLDTAVTAHHRVMAGTNHATWRQYAHFVVANPVAFFFAAGLPSTALWFGHLRSQLRDGANANQRWLSLSFALSLLILVVAPVHTLEVEHIWLYMVPFLALGAAARLTGGEGSDKPEEEPPQAASLALALLTAQAILMELLLHTMW